MITKSKAKLFLGIFLVSLPFWGFPLLALASGRPDVALATIIYEALLFFMACLGWLAGELIFSK